MDGEDGVSELMDAFNAEDREFDAALKLLEEPNVRPISRGRLLASVGEIW